MTLGEIGPRLGMNTNDNGYLRFHHHRIPRTHLLMKHSQVLEVRGGRRRKIVEGEEKEEEEEDCRGRKGGGRKEGRL